MSALWPAILKGTIRIGFAYRSFHWRNLAAHNAGVTVSIIGLRNEADTPAVLIDEADDGQQISRVTTAINAYLLPGPNVYVRPIAAPYDERSKMQFGNHPYYANALMFSPSAGRRFVASVPEALELMRPLYGSKELIASIPRQCLWIIDSEASRFRRVPGLCDVLDTVMEARQAKSSDGQAKKLVDFPHRFRDQYEGTTSVTVVPIVSSENRPYLPVGVVGPRAVVHNKAFAMYDAPLWNMALIASRLHWVWIGTVCVRMRMDFSYSNTLGWNTFPVPALTEQNKADLTRCAEDILLARETHFPATIADLYYPDDMPANLRAAHETNDEVLERIYIGRRFRNDTERLEKLFEMYAKMTATGAGNITRRSPSGMTARTTKAKAKTTPEVQS